MEAIRPSETSVDTQRTTRRYIPEDGILVKNLFRPALLSRLHSGCGNGANALLRSGFEPDSRSSSVTLLSELTQYEI
jgi:hypothetical protein